MIYDDLMVYGRPGADAAERDRRIRNKCRADMVYWQVLREMFAAYGAPDGRNISDIDPDTLGALRDEMAMRASDQGLMTWRDGGIDTFSDGVGGSSRELEGPALRRFVRQAFRNSQGLRNMVRKHLVSAMDHRASPEELTDGHLDDLTEQEFQRILSDAPGSPFSRAVSAAESMSGEAGTAVSSPGGPDFWPCRLPLAEIEGQRSVSGRRVQGLCISPLMPEFRSLRRLNVENPDGGGFQFAPRLNRLGLRGSYQNLSPEERAADSRPLLFDPDRRLLSLYPADFRNRYMNAPAGDVFQSGIQFGGDTRWRGVQMQGQEPLSIGRQTYDDEQLALGAVSGPYLNPVYEDRKSDGDMSLIAAWKLADTLSRVSGEQLNAQDQVICRDIMTGNPYLFGVPSRDGTLNVKRTSDAYIGTLQHMAESAREHMSSHEFEVHLVRQRALEGSSAERAVAMCCTGERWRTADSRPQTAADQSAAFSQARRSSARCVIFYPFTDYVPRNPDVSPMMGDIEQPDFSRCLFTNRNLRRQSELLRQNIRRGGGRDPAFSASAGGIGTDQIAAMRSTADEYFSAPGWGQPVNRLTRRALRRSPGSRDLGDYVLDDGSISGAMITEDLARDMDMIKDRARAEYASGLHRERMGRILDRVLKEAGGISGDGDVPGPDRADEIMDAFQARHGSDWAQRAGEMLEQQMQAEVRRTYGQDFRSAACTEHVYRDLLDSFLSGSGSWSERRRRLEAQMSDPGDPVLGASLDSWFGQRVSRGGREQVILRAGACRSASLAYTYDEYTALLEMLSWSGSAVYERSSSRSAGETLRDRDPDRVRCVVQAQAGGGAGAADDGDDTGEGPESVSGLDLQESSVWLDSLFADPDDRSGHTLAWCLRDWPHPDVNGIPDWWTAEHPGGSRRDYLDERAQHAVFNAVHPLQVEAMHHMRDGLDEFGVTDDDIRITDRGILCCDREGVRMRLGPVLDEAGYVRPCILEQNVRHEDPGPGRGYEKLEQLKRDGAGNLVRDSLGRCETETVWARYENYFYMDRDTGKLMNPVVFGALDMQDGSVPSRFYGISGRVLDWDGYDHQGQSFHERLELSTLQMSVLENLDRNLQLYRTARDTVQAGDPGWKQAAAVLCTSINSGCLCRCLRSNTYIIGDPGICRAGDQYMRNFVQRPGFDRETWAESLCADPDHPEECRRAADLLMMQANMLRSRVVLPKIDLNQNIGLCSQLNNPDQMTLDGNGRTGMDDKSSRMSDAKGARVAIFGDSAAFDPVLSGSASSLGAVGYLSDAAQIDRFTGKLTVEPGAPAGTGTRACAVSQGITSFENGGQVLRFSRFPGAQAVDRMQLSTNAILKSLYASEASYAMINLGYNMEDGQVIAKRSAAKFGHFDRDGVFHEAGQWDKIGDGESGNKGVIAKVVDTDITSAEEFQARYLWDALKTAGIQGFPGDPRETGAAADAVREKLFPDRDDLPGGSVEGLFRGLLGGDMEDLKEMYRNLDRSGLQKRLELERDIRERKEQMFEKVKEPCGELCRQLLERNAEPFAGRCRLDQSLWQLFHDNPDLDLAVTNVCVCTRSNPSILMSIQEGAEQDRRAMEAAGVPDSEKEAWLREHGVSTLNVRDENGVLHSVTGGKGRAAIYADCHTAEDKNKDYVRGDVSRPGRAFGPQEQYMMQARHGCGDALRCFLAEDSTLPDRIMKLNRKILMSGYAVDLRDPDLKIRTSADMLSDAKLEQTEDGCRCVSENMPGVPFIDAQVLADQIFDQIPDRSPRNIARIVDGLGKDADFSRAFQQAGVYGEQESRSTLHRMFQATLGSCGGGWLLLPENMSGISLSADIGLPKGEDETGAPVNRLKTLSGAVTMPDGSTRTAIPLFISARESEDGSSGTSVSTVEDRLQFSMFQTVTACALVDRISREQGPSGGTMLADPARCRDAASGLSRRLRQQGAQIPSRPSLSLDGMGDWMKKNVYRTVFPNSLTCVWSGNPGMAIDEAGISFEKARSLGLLHRRADISDEDFAVMKDRFEFISEAYEPLTDRDRVLVNRSPGQTTGCMRALRVRITGEKGDGLEINPACAKIFDGDFDGDTVGVCSYRRPGSLPGDFREQRDMMRAADREVERCFTMQANMCHTADYTSIRRPDGTEVSDIHPLFIADNADIAVAKYNMSRPDPATGQPRCGYDVQRELDSVTMMANAVEQLIRCGQDYENVEKDGRALRPEGGRGIRFQDADRTAGTRRAKIDEILPFFSGPEPPDMTERDRQNRAAWARMAGDVRRTAARFDRNRPRSAEDLGTRPVLSGRDMAELMAVRRETFAHMSRVYQDMTGHITGPSLYVHGASGCEIARSVIEDSNISKKGKDAQLNALLSFGGLGDRCSVVRDTDRKAHLAVDGRLDHEMHPELSMSAERSVSDVFVSKYPEARFRTQIESNIVAQACKSDATGIGGSLAQRMQKVLSPFGYGEFGLRISGPITQKFLDSKQNVSVSESNLNQGKTNLVPVGNFRRVEEFSRENLEKKTPEQIYAGQFSSPGGWMSPEECIDQTDAFLQVMGQPGLSETDRAQMASVLEQYASKDRDGNTAVKSPVQQADRTMDQTYAAMYPSGRGSFAAWLESMAQEGKGLCSGSIGLDGRIRADRTAAAVEREYGRILSWQSWKPLPKREVPAQTAARTPREKAMARLSALLGSSREEEKNSPDAGLDFQG